MSFSSDARAEIARGLPETPTARRNLLGGLTAFCGHIGLVSGGAGHSPGWCLIWETRSAPVARALFRLVVSLSGARPEIRTSFPGGRSQGRQYRLSLDATQSSALAEGDVFSLSQVRLRSLEEKQYYLRGAFLGAGYVKNPRKGYQAEFVCAHDEHAQRLARLLLSFGIRAKSQQRKGNTVLYIKDSEQISMLLRLLGASQALLTFENVRILRQMRANVNRQVNFETANVEKTIDASTRYAAIVDFLEQGGHLDSFPEPVQETARLRRDYPDIPLEELGQMLEPPASKSAVNHRLRKIKAYYEKISEGH